MEPTMNQNGECVQQASSHIDRERTAMELIHASLNSGPWSMEFDENGDMTSCVWSDTFRHMLGYTSEEDFPDVLESWSSLLHEEDKPHVMREYWNTVRDYTGVKTYDVRYRLLTRNKGWRWFHAAGRLARRHDGSPVAFYGLFVDIDDQKKIEDQLQSQTSELQKALEAAQYANQAKATFLSNMSHDIRTPMNAIIGYTNFALESTDPIVQREYLQSISVSSKHLLSLINQILEFSKIENRELEISEELTDLNEFCRRLEIIFKIDMETKRLTYTTTLDVRHTSVYMDSTHSFQILANIISNAIKYTPEDGTIDISCKELPGSTPDTCTLETVVRDTGLGMSREFLSHAFDTFSREQTSTISGIQGTGLGLAIVKNLADLMQGTIQIESALGQGTTVTIRIPHRLDVPSEAEEKAVKGSEEIDLGILTGKHILVTDDIDINAMIVSKLLLSKGCTVERARDGVECVDMVRNADAGHYDLVLMDIQMPNMNGYDAARAIRAFEDLEKAGIPILALTANAFQEDIDKAFAAGMDGHIAKPLDANILFRTMAAAFYERQTG